MQLEVYQSSPMRQPTESTYHGQILEHKIQPEARPLAQIQPPSHGSHASLSEQGRDALERLDEAEKAEKSAR